MLQIMKAIFKRFVIIPLLLLVAGCVNEDDLNHSNNDNGIYSLKVQMPESDNPTRVDLTQVEGTKDLKATWRAYDKVLVLLTQGDKDFNTGTWNVSEISEDGKQATIYFGLPDGINQKKPFTVYGFTGIEATVQYYEDNKWHPRCMAALLRAPIEKFKAPMFAQVEANYGQTSITSFHHFGTYELLHVKNNSNESVSIAHNGFDIDMPWYQAAAFVEPNDGNGPVRPSGEWDGEDFSDSQTIAAGAEGVFISWYIPSGFPIAAARLLASVNGEELSSTNTFSSEVSLQRGHAYHMYATWDGESLSFDKGDIEKHKLIKVEPSEIDFGRVPVGTTKTEHFTVSNVGTADLTFSVEEIHGEFDIPESGKEFTLTPEETKIFDVTFTPSEVDVSGGPVVDIYSDAENGMQSIGLSGTGGEGGNPSCPVAEAIDLGLPSGTLWASWNVGASSPEEYGGYYSWGETEEKDYYDWSTYTHCDGSKETCHHIGDDIAGTEYDVAHVKWGAPWNMPSQEQINELKDNCTRTWTTQNGVDGILLTGPNGASIFLPAAGFRKNSGLRYQGSRGYYWSSSLFPDYEYYALDLRFYTDDWGQSENLSRFYGQSVRPVITPEKPQDCPVAEAIDLGLPSGTKWASWNVGASKPEEYGGYYAWGETEEKDYYDWSTYIYCDGSSSTCHHIGDDIAGTEYDVAHVKWGGSWRMPTREQQDELRKNCTREWTQQNSVNGIRVTGPNGNSIFLPAAGNRWPGGLYREGSDGYYWSSSLYPYYGGYRACSLSFDSGYWGWSNYGRDYGLSVRAVCP